MAATILPLIDDPASAGQTHWTVTKLCGWLRVEKDFDLAYRTLVRYLHEHGYARRIPRPVPEPPDRDAWLRYREAIVPQLAALLEDPSVLVLFGDEARFEGDPRPRQKSVKRVAAARSKVIMAGHLRRNAIGAVTPATGQLVSLLVPHCDKELFQVFLDTVAAEVPDEGSKTVHLVLDNASWHKSTSLEWHHLKPV